MAKLTVENGYYTVDIFRGDSSDIFLDNFRDDADAPLDLTTLYSDIRFQIRRAKNFSTTLMSKTLGDGITIEDDSSGNTNAALLISIPASESAALPPGTLSGDLEFTLMDGETVFTWETEAGNEEWKINVDGDTTR